MLFPHWFVLDSGPPHPLEAEAAWEAGGASIPVLLPHTDPAAVYSKRKKKRIEEEAQPEAHADRVSRHGMQVGRDRPSISELSDRGASLIQHYILHPAPWLNSTMFSSDCCSSEIPGLGKHVCYADSRTTSFTRLTSPPSVRKTLHQLQYLLLLLSSPIHLQWAFLFCLSYRCFYAHHYSFVAYGVSISQIKLVFFLS